MTTRGEISEEQIYREVQHLHGRIEQRLSQKGRGSFASRHEILGVIEEEVYEYKMAVHEGTDDDRINELMDIAVGAVFGIACIRNRRVDW